MIKTLRILLCSVLLLAVTACTGITPKPDQIAKFNDIVIVYTETPALTLPTFSEGFWDGYAARYPGALGQAMKPNVENIAKLKPPMIPDFGLVLAQKIGQQLPENFKTWPHTQVDLAVAEAREPIKNKATLEVRVKSIYASWVHGYIMCMAELTMYSPTGDIVMSKMLAANGLYIKNSKKIEDIVKGNVNMLGHEYELTADDMASQLTSSLKGDGIK